MLFWIWMICLLLAVFLYMRHISARFDKAGVKYFTPVPFFGNMTRILLRQEHFVDNIDRTYNSFPNERYVGRFEFISPMIVVRDLELIKKITVKDFEHFLDHRVKLEKETDPLFGANLFSLKGDEWKDMRSTLSPAFTSSKIRLMVPLILEVGEQTIEVLKKRIEESGTDSVEVDVKDLLTRYATDVIASCAFGLKVNSQKEENEFYKKGYVAANFGFRQLLVFFGFTAFPKIMNALRISLFSKDSQSFFREIVSTTMQEREAHNIIRPDMIHLLMEAKKGKLVHTDQNTVDIDAGFSTVEESAVGKKEINRVWTDDDLAAQAVLFFIAGFETASSAMSFLLHELAVNPEVQDKLVEEIRENDRKNGGKFDYNSIIQMKYLDMVVSELLRRWSPGIALDRLCTKDYNLGKPNSGAKEDYIMRKGEGLMIPAWALHHDPQYFEDPYKFDPERFSDENKHKIKPFTYFPFGLGPRNCVGSRFALCEVKVMAYQLLRTMEVVPGKKTQIPVTLSTETFNLRIKGGHWLKFKVRK